METLIDWLKKEGYTVDNVNIYYEACTHSSYANEHPNVRHDNERLEFMGDAVLQMWSSTQLFKIHPPLSEGRMTTMRAGAVCETALAKLNKELGWYKFLRLGVGEEKTGGRQRMSLMADQFEAIIGAIYIDLGYDVVDELLMKYMLPTIINEEEEDLKDYKTHLQEVVQADSRKTIHYKMIEEVGPSNAPTFTMGVFLDDILLGTGKASTKKKAEQLAARNAFEKLAK